MNRKGLFLFKSVLDLMERGETVLCTILFGAVLCMYTLEVFTRYVLNYSSVFTGEIGLYFMTWTYFIGFAILFKHGENIILEYFFDRFPPALKKWLSWITHWLILLFTTVVFVGSLKLFSVTSRMDHPILPIRQCYATLPIVVGSFLTMMVALYFAWEGTVRMFGKNEIDARP